MCILCEEPGSNSGSIFDAARVAAMATDKVTRASLLYASALVAIAHAFEPRGCRAVQRKAFTSLVKVSASFVAEFKAIGESDGATDLEVSIARRQLFFAVFRRAREVLGLKPEPDYLPDVLWTLERGEYLAKALVNLAQLAGGTEFDFKEVERGLSDLAGLANAICEWQMELTGEGPQSWSADSAAARADRLAMVLFDAAEDIAVARHKRVPGA